MAYTDLPLGQTPPRSSPPPRRSSTVRIVIVVALCLAAGALLTMWWMSRTPAEPTSPTPVAATDVLDESNRPLRQPISLPSLDGSDALLRELVGVLADHPQLARLLATDGLVRGATLATIQIGEGRTPNRPMGVLRPERRVGIQGTDSGRVDPASYARWNAATTALTAVDPAELAQVYVNVKPLFDEAYREQGYPEGSFDDALVQAIDMLAATPTLEDDPVLIRRPDYYIHEDPKLRALRPVQKQFLLFGAENQARVMAWLRRFARALDLPTRR